jgi:hypothetical protein
VKERTPGGKRWDVDSELGAVMQNSECNVGGFEVDASACAMSILVYVCTIRNREQKNVPIKSILLSSSTAHCLAR